MCLFVFLYSLSATLAQCVTYRVAPSSGYPSAIVASRAVERACLRIRRASVSWGVHHGLAWGLDRWRGTALAAAAVMQDWKKSVAASISVGVVALISLCMSGPNILSYLSESA